MKEDKGTTIPPPKVLVIARLHHCIQNSMSGYGVPMVAYDRLAAWAGGRERGKVEV